MSKLDGYHVKLNGKGYILQDESYAIQSQQPFSPRFATGDPGFGDLSFWQFLTQEDFSGGEGQEDFSDKTKYLESIGWEIKEGKPRLSFGSSLHTTTEIQNNGAGYAKMFGFGASLFVVFGTSGSSAGTITSASGVRQINAKDARIIYRDQTPTANWNRYLATVFTNAGQRFEVRNLDSSALTSVSNIVTGLEVISLIIQIDEINFLIGGTAGSSDGQITAFEIIRYAAESWTVSVQETLAVGQSGLPLNNYGTDSNGVIYVGTHTFSGTPIDKVEGIWRIIPADIITTKPSITSFTPIADMIIGAVFDLNGVIYYSGAEILDHNNKNGKLTYRRIIKKWPNTTVYASRKIITAGNNTNTGLRNHTIGGIWLTVNGAYFVGETSLSTQKPILRLTPDDAITELFSVASEADTVPGFQAMTTRGGRIFYYDGTTGEIRKVSGTRGKLDNITHAILKLSKFGANTPLINKSLYSLTIEISEKMPTNEKITILINDEELGTLTNADGIEKEIVAKKEFTASSFQPVIKILATSRWTGSIEKITIRYIPTQFKKKAWSFAIRSTNNLRRLNGKAEPRTGGQIMTDIISAWSSNTPIDYMDSDEREYKVIVTDFKGRQPLLNDDAGKRELVVPIEILEV